MLREPNDVSDSMRWSKRGEKRRQERFKALTLPHLDMLLGIARRRMSDTALAEDLVQDTYMRAWEAFDGLVDEAQVRAWLVRILQRVTSDHYRTHLRRQTLLAVTRLEHEHSEIPASHQEDPLEVLISRYSDERVADALIQLPREFMEALELHDIEGFKYREVAEIMEVPLGTVMSRIARGRRLLAALILKDRRAWDLDPTQAADANAHT
ncbi:MAG: sigma-70 family RNA polymerase sigma factor, partial [Gammaproteobacteria bacterium]